MIDAGVFLLLNLNNGTILESPLDNVSLLAGSLDKLAALKVAIELGEVLELDEVPDVGERGCSIDQQNGLFDVDASRRRGSGAGSIYP